MRTDLPVVDASLPPGCSVATRQTSSASRNDHRSLTCRYGRCELRKESVNVRGCRSRHTPVVTQFVTHRDPSGRRADTDHIASTLRSPSSSSQIHAAHVPRFGFRGLGWARRSCPQSGHRSFRLAAIVASFAPRGGTAVRRPLACKLCTRRLARSTPVRYLGSTSAGCSSWFAASRTVAVGVAVGPAAPVVHCPAAIPLLRYGSKCESWTPARRRRDLGAADQPPYALRDQIGRLTTRTY